MGSSELTQELPEDGRAGGGEARAVALDVSRIETAQVGVRPRDVRALLEIYEVTEVRR
jgi:hypothetical protein